MGAVYIKVAMAYELDGKPVDLLRGQYGNSAKWGVSAPWSPWEA
jgi:hypothetical protein